MFRFFRLKTEKLIQLCRSRLRPSLSCRGSSVSARYSNWCDVAVRSEFRRNWIGVSSVDSRCPARTGAAARPQPGLDTVALATARRIWVATTSGCAFRSTASNRSNRGRFSPSHPPNRLPRRCRQRRRASPHGRLANHVVAVDRDQLGIRQCLRQSPHMVDLDELIAERPDDHRRHPDLRHVLVDPARSVVELQFVGDERVEITRRHAHRQQPLLKSGIDRLGGEGVLRARRRGDALDHVADRGIDDGAYSGHWLNRMKRAGRTSMAVDCNPPAAGATRIRLARLGPARPAESRPVDRNTGAAQVVRRRPGRNPGGNRADRESSPPPQPVRAARRNGSPCRAG